MAMAFSHYNDTLHDGRRLLVRLAVCSSHNSGMPVLLTLHPAVALHFFPKPSSSSATKERKKKCGGHPRYDKIAVGLSSGLFQMKKQRCSPQLSFPPIYTPNFFFFRVRFSYLLVLEWEEAWAPRGGGVDSEGKFIVQKWWGEKWWGVGRKEVAFLWLWC